MKNWLIGVLACIQLPVALAAQDMHWQVNYRQKVYAAYDNLLSVSRQENFKEYTQYLSASLHVSFVTDNRLVVWIKETASAHSTLHLPRQALWIYLDDQKQIDSIFFTAPPSREEEIAVRTLLSCIRYFRIKDIPVNRRYKEDGIDGRFPVRYFPVAGKHTNGAMQVQKEMLQPDNNPSAIQRIIFDEFKAVYTANPVTGIIDSILVMEKKHQKIQNKIIAWVNTVVELYPVNQPPPPVKMDIPVNRGNWYAAKLYNEPDPQLRHRLISEKLLQNKSLAALLLQLQAIQHYSYAQQVQLSAGFRAWAFLNPGSMDTLTRLMDRYPVDADAFNLLLDALVNTPHPAAQKLLASLLDRFHSSPEALQVLLPKVAGTVLPGPELINRLYSLQQSLQDNEMASLAGLCLANLLRIVRDKMPGLYDSTLLLLQQQYEQQQTNEYSVRRFLTESGNIGDTIFTGAIARYLNVPGNDWQHEAIYALRFLHSERADSLFAEQFKLHTDSACFTLLYEVLGLRYPSQTVINGIISYIQKQANVNEAACLQLIDYLGNYIDELPSPVETLKRVQGSVAIQEAAKAVLEKYRSYKKYQSFGELLPK